MAAQFDKDKLATTMRSHPMVSRKGYEEAVYKGAALTKKDLVALREAQVARGVTSIEGDDISTAESRLAAAQRVAVEVESRDEKIRCLEREVNSIDAVFDEARLRREELARKIELQHEEVLERIAAVRNQVTVESHRRHRELKEFKKKFDADIEFAHQDFIKEVDNRGEEVGAHLTAIDLRLDTAAEELKAETEERVRHIKAGTEEMQEKLGDFAVLLQAEEVAREKEEARILADLQDIFERAVERIKEHSQEREKRLKRITNEIVKEYKRQSAKQTEHQVWVNHEIAEIDEVIHEEAMDREACQEKLVGNLQDFLSEFSRNIEYENQEKREAIEEMKASMQVAT
jgi:hypothetical protein